MTAGTVEPVSDVSTEDTTTEAEADPVAAPTVAPRTFASSRTDKLPVGPNVRSMEVGDQVLFNPEDRYEVDVRGKDYLILRERDIHAVAAKRLEEGSTGLYL